MNETLSKVTNFADGSSKDPKENIDLAWNMAHAEKPFQDAALESKKKVEFELRHAGDSMSEDLSAKVDEIKDYEKLKNSGFLQPIETGGREKQVTVQAQQDQETAFKNAEKYMAEVRDLQVLAAEASEKQIAVYERLKKLEQELKSL